MQSVEVTEADQDDPDIDNTYKISAEFYVGPAKAQFLAYLQRTIHIQYNTIQYNTV